MHQKERTPISRAAKAISEALIGKAVGTLVLSLAISQAANAEDWKGIRMAPGDGASKWTEVPCEAGTGWRLCQPPLNLSLVASPASIAGTGSTSTTLTLTVKDVLGNSVGAGVPVSWSTNRGTLSATSSSTNAQGKATVTLTSAKTLLDATVTATAQTDEGGSHSLVVDFIDSWIATAPTYPTDWSAVTSASTDASGAYGCDAWTPDPSTVNAGQAFTQTGTGCERQYTRQQQNREVSEVTGDIRNSGSAFAIYEVRGNQSTMRSATGSKIVTTCKPYAFGKYAVWQFGPATGVTGGKWQLIWMNSPTIYTLEDAFHYSYSDTPFQEGYTTSKNGVTLRLGPVAYPNDNAWARPSGNLYQICTSN